MMEFTKFQVASLVLGYLKNEKLYKAYDAFLETSPHFRSRSATKFGKFFVTRVSGLSLTDILEEYTAIYSIVHGHLEASDYYNKQHSKTSLAKQLLYVLDSNDIVCQSTLPPTSDSEVETTPEDALPGNNGRTRRKHLEYRKARSKGCTGGNNPDRNDALDMSEVLTQTFLENQELQERIAETINMVRNSPVEPRPRQQCENIGAGASHELEAMIKTAVQRTEEDPIYNKFIHELVDFRPGDSTSNSSPSKHSQSETGTDDNAPKTVHIDEYNNDAVRQIIEASQNDNVFQPNHTVRPTNHIQVMTTVQQPFVGNLTVTAPQILPPIVTSALQGLTFPNTCLTVPVPKPLPLVQNPIRHGMNNSNDVYIYEGTLDSLLKNGTNAAPQAVPNNAFAGGGYLIVPPDKQLIFNNILPLCESDIMKMPTIIVNDSGVKSATREIRPKLGNDSDITEEFLIFNEENVPDLGIAKKGSPQVKTPFVTVKSNHPAPSKTSDPIQRPSSAVRNLDFSTPPTSIAAKRLPGIWDQELRTIVEADSKAPAWNRTKKKGKVSKKKNAKTKKQASSADEKEPSPDLTQKKEESSAKNEKEAVPAPANKDKGEAPTTPVNNKGETPPANEKKATPEKTASDSVCEKETPPLITNSEAVTPPILPKDSGASPSAPKSTVDSMAANDKERLLLVTPIKESRPKTPGADLSMNSCQYTPFNNVLDVHLAGMDLDTIPTPKFPITPGFGLTPGLATTPGVNNRLTDYSTSSSYYQPSDHEQNKSIEQMMEEFQQCKEIEKPKPEVLVLSNVVIETAQDKVLKKPNNDARLKSFNSNVIGRKNLNLLRPASPLSTTSSESSSETDSVQSEDTSNKTIIYKDSEEPPEKVIEEPKSTRKSRACKESSMEIKSILSTIKPRRTLVTEKSVNSRTQLEEKRQRTIQKMQSDSPKKPRGRVRAPPKPRAARKNAAPKKSVEEPKDPGAQMVEDLWERGIHLVPNKAPPVGAELDVCFNTVTLDTVIEAEHVLGKRAPRNKADYDLGWIRKSFNAQVYSEFLNQDIMRTISFCSYELGVDPVEKLVKGARKRKNLAAESNQGKKQRRESIELLKDLDMDSFLDTIHGDH